MREEDPDVSNWEKMVTLAQAEFWEEPLAEARAWKTAVIILKEYDKRLLWDRVSRGTVGGYNQDN